MKKSTKELKKQTSKSRKLSRVQLHFADVLDQLEAAETGRPIRQYTEFKTRLAKDVRKNGYKMHDIRLNRDVISFPGHFVVIKNQAILKWLRLRILISKYLEDWNRMIPSFLACTWEAKKNPSSRRLMVFNDFDYFKIFQCFTHMQFMMTHRNEFDLYVYQRSADLDKLDDDLTFFVHVADAFEREVGKKVTKIVVVYGNVHDKV